MTLHRSYTDALERSLAQVIASARQDMAVCRAEMVAEMATLRADLAEARASCAALENELRAANADAVERIEAQAAEAIRGLSDAQVQTLGDLRAGLDDAARAVVTAAVAAIPAPDLSGLATRDEMEALARRIDTLPPPPDLSGLATREDVAEVRATIPPPPDLSGFATHDDVAASVAAIRIPDIPAPPDLSPYASREDVEAVRAAIPVLPEPVDLSGLATREDVEALRSAIPEVPEARDWLPEIGAVSGAVEQARAEMLDRLARHPGKLPVLRAWDDRVHYAGEMVTQDGATWQAQRDTGKAPPHEDWAIIAGRGAPGLPGRSMAVRGTYDPALGYEELDVVTLNGSSFLARQDDPGPCPGPGWQLLASAGGRGKKGDPGERRADSATVAALFMDDDEFLTLTMSDGTEHRADLGAMVRR